MRKLGRTDIEITPIGLGVMQFAGGHAVQRVMFPSMDQQSMDDIVKAALDGGINWFDTAEFYGFGVSEQGLANALQAAELILETMDEMARRKVTHQELQYAKEYTKGNLLLAAESIDNQMVRLAQNEFHFERNIPLKTVVEHIETVTPDDILKLANTLLETNTLSLTLLGQVVDRTAHEDIVSAYLNA